LALLPVDDRATMHRTYIASKKQDTPMSSDHSSPVIRSRRHALKTVRPGLCGALCVPLAVASLWIDIACAQAPAEVAAATEPVCLCAVALRSGSFYSLQRPDYPPFPVNPFPELPVYRIDSNGQVTPWSLVSNLLEEVKVATAKQTASGWEQGQLYFGLGIGAGAEGEIGQVSTDGTGVTLNWADLPLPPGEFFRGSLAFDQTGILGGDLIAVTGGPDEQGGARQVWRVDSAGAPTLIASIGTGHLEGVVVLPNDPVWGVWAGKVLTGDEYDGVIYAIDTSGTATPYSLGIYPEDFDLIPPDQDLYCTDSGGAILKIPRACFADYVGQLLITQAGEHMQPAALYVVRWHGGPVVSVRSPYPSGFSGHFEQVTFAPVSLPPLP